MDSEHLSDSKSSMNLTSHHRLMSVSVCSNIPDFSEPICFVSKGNDEELIQRLVDYLDQCHQSATEILNDSFQDVFKRLEDYAVDEDEVENLFKDKKFAPESVINSRQIQRLSTRLHEYISIVPVIGFNSSSYDLNVMKATLLKHLQLNGSIKYVIKRESRLQCIQTDKFKFLDMMNYLTPGTSYDRYLKAYGVSTHKVFFRMNTSQVWKN